MNNLPDWEQEAESCTPDYDKIFALEASVPIDAVVPGSVQRLARRMFAAGMRYTIYQDGDGCDENANVPWIQKTADKIERGEL